MGKHACIVFQVRRRLGRWRRSADADAFKPNSAMPTFEHFPMRPMSSGFEDSNKAAEDSARRRRNRDALIADNLMSTESGRAAVARMRRECEMVS